MAKIPSEFSFSRIECPRCRYNLREAYEFSDRKHIDYNDVICDNCSKKLHLSKLCSKCDEAVTRIIYGESASEDKMKKRLKLWLSKVKKELREILTNNKDDGQRRGGLRDHVFSETYLGSLYGRIHSPNHLRTPDVKQLLDSGLHERVRDAEYESKNIKNRHGGAISMPDLGECCVVPECYEKFVQTTESKGRSIPGSDYSDHFSDMRLHEHEYKKLRPSLIPRSATKRYYNEAKNKEDIDKSGKVKEWDKADMDKSGKKTEITREDINKSGKERGMPKEDIDKSGKERDWAKEDIHKNEKERNRAKEDMDKSEKERGNLKEDIDKSDNERSKAKEEIDKSGKKRDGAKDDIDKRGKEKGKVKDDIDKSEKERDKVRSKEGISTLGKGPGEKSHTKNDKDRDKTKQKDQKKEDDDFIKMVKADEKLVLDGMKSTADKRFKGKDKEADLKPPETGIKVGGKQGAIKDTIQNKEQNESGKEIAKKGKDTMKDEFEDQSQKKGKEKPTKEDQEFLLTLKKAKLEKEQERQAKLAEAKKLAELKKKAEMEKEKGQAKPQMSIKAAKPEIVISPSDRTLDFKTATPSKDEVIKVIVGQKIIKQRTPRLTLEERAAKKEKVKPPILFKTTATFPFDDSLGGKGDLAIGIKSEVHTRDKHSEGKAVKNNKEKTPISAKTARNVDDTASGKNAVVGVSRGDSGKLKDSKGKVGKKTDNQNANVSIALLVNGSISCRQI